MAKASEVEARRESRAAQLSRSEGFDVTQRPQRERKRSRDLPYVAFTFKPVYYVLTDHINKSGGRKLQDLQLGCSWCKVHNYSDSELNKFVKRHVEITPCLAYIRVLSCAVQPVFLVPHLSQASLYQQNWLLPDDKTTANDDVRPGCVTGCCFHKKGHKDTTCTYTHP